MITNVIFTVFFGILIFLADKLGDSEKSTAWMFFLGPIGLFGMTAFWGFRAIQCIYGIS